MATHQYSQAEELASGISHAIGAVLALIGIVYMLNVAIPSGMASAIVAFSVFGTSLFILYLMSALYHLLPIGKPKRVLKVLDHASIYLLIAGSYTPFTLLVLKGSQGWLILGTIWLIAIIGISLEAFWVNRSKIVSAILYVGISWFIILFIQPLASGLGTKGMVFLLAGGAFYTLGAVIYALKRIPWHHPVWHLFVLGGSIMHFFAVLQIRIV